MTQTQQTGTVRLERTMRAPAERIYRAFLDRHAQTKFMPPRGYVAEFPKLEPHVGGTFYGTFRSLDGREKHSFGGTFLELEEFTRMRWNDRFDTEDEAMQGTMEVTVTLEEKDGATKVTVVQTGIPAVVPPEMAQTGWGQTLDQLRQLVEFDAPAEPREAA